MGFRFENNLQHQNHAVTGVLRAFEDIDINQISRSSAQNPELGLVKQKDLLQTNLEKLIFQWKLVQEKLMPTQKLCWK